MKNRIINLETPFVFEEKSTGKKHEVHCAIDSGERKLWCGKTKMKVNCTFQRSVKSQWLDLEYLNHNATFAQRYSMYHQLENACVDEAGVDWLLPEISTALFMALDKYIPEDFIADLARNIQRRYTEPGRYWHNEKHIREVLLFLLKHIEEQDQWLLLDAIFHDIVYQPGDENNELNSVQILHEAMEACDAKRRENMARFGFSLPAKQTFAYWPNGNYDRGILATKDHVTDDPLIALLLDADMEVLSSELNRYRRYARAIRQEFSMYNYEDYVCGRIPFLKSVIALPRIFISSASTSVMEDQARENMQWEMEMLIYGEPI